MNVRSTIALAGAVVLSACVSTNAARLGTAMVRPVVDPEMVAVYRTASQVPRQYDEVALLNSTGMSGWTNEAGMLKSMRREAGRSGANAVVLDAIIEPNAATKVVAALIGVGAERKGKALAIYVHPADKAP